MKKFTRDFLLGELGIWRHLRKIGLGLVLALWTTLAFSQGNQITYQLKAADYTDCYRVDNDYVVPVMMQDFLKLKKFELKLHFSSDFVFTGTSGTLGKLSAMTTSVTPDVGGGGTINLFWNSATSVTLDETVGEWGTVFNLHFKIPSFQHQYSVANQFVFSSLLNWTQVDLWNDAGQCDILNSNIKNGSLTVTEKWQAVTLDAGVANCFGTNAIVTVSTPAHVAGMSYSFNGATYQLNNNSSSVFAPSTNNTLVIKDATCISYIKLFDVDAVKALTFTAATPVYTNCPGGLGDLEIIPAGGTKPYTYYVVPVEQWNAGDNMYNQLLNNNVLNLNKYDYVNNVIQLEAGTVANPRVYYVAVQDANGCAVISGTNLMNGWKRVEVIDNNDPWDITTLETTVLMTTCYGQKDGRIVFEIEGGTPWTSGYNIVLNGVYVGKMSVYDSNVETLCNGVPCLEPVLGPGTYTFVITDANGCSTTVTYIITQPKQIKFAIDHTDAGCDLPVGQLWIASVDETTGTGPTTAWHWRYTTDPSWINAAETSAWFAIDYKAINLPAGVYYVEVQDAKGCTEVWRNEIGDDAIKILTTVFELVYDPIKCYGGSTTAKIILLPGSGDANHTFKYKAELLVGGVYQIRYDWQASNSFTGLIAGEYRFSVMDETAFNCVVEWKQIITQPDPVVATPLTGLLVPPSCPGNIDGNIAISVEGGTPWPGNRYRFYIDDRPSTMAEYSNDFAVGAGVYTITVEDANGCKSEPVAFFVPGGEDRIEFVNEIRLQCAGDKVNLFNTDPTNDWEGHIGLDQGYMTDLSWYPRLNHTSDGDDAIMFSYWTSGTGWVTVPVQGNIYDRNPVLWISTVASTKPSEIVANGTVVTHITSYGAGTYYLVAKDEWGCYSNIEKIVIIDAIPLSINVTTIDASCFNTWTGKIKIEAFSGGKYCLPTEFVEGVVAGNGEECVRYQYVLVQQPDIFTYPNWYGEQVTWKNFRNNNSPTNDSVSVIAVQKGTYWIAVRSFCSIHDPGQIQFFGPIVVGGLDAITATINSTNVSCFDYTDGSITVVGAGGAGGYTYELALANVPKPNPKTGWPLKNTTGIFGNLAAGTYTVTVKDKLGCKPFVKTVTITQPALLVLTLEKVYPSCYGNKDGIIRYIITGGTQPYKESTNNGENWYEIPKNNLATTTFDRRAGAGTYVVMIEDAHGCRTEKTVELLQPAALSLTLTLKTKVACAQAESCNATNQTADGVITATVGGGWNLATDGFLYYVVATKGGQTITKTMDKTGAVDFTGLNIGEWSFKLYEWNSAFAWGQPYIQNPAYATVYAGGFPSIYQNPDITSCVKTAKMTMVSNPPIAYNVKYVDIKCHNGNDGEIQVTNLTGGVAPYQFMIQGPAGNASNGIWYPSPATNNTFYTFKALTWGHYNVFVKDSRGCQVCLESGTIHNPDSLELKVKLIENATCWNTATGKITLEAKGGVGALQYAVALAAEVEDLLFPLDDPIFIGKLKWQTSPDFMVKAGVWIGYVKDANGCVQGHATNAAGVRIMNHRVVVLEPLEVKGTATSGLTMATGMVDCFGNATGWIRVLTLTGGSGSGWSANVTGLDYTGAAVSKWYSNVSTSGTGSQLTGLKASTNIKDPAKVPDAEKYSVVFYDSHGCASAPVKVAVFQPFEFEIELYVTQDAFICPDDLAGVFEIRILSGGVTPITYRYEAWDGTVKKVDSQWGAVNTFQGPAGLLYKVWAKDANGCVAYVEKFIKKPAAIMFLSIQDVTCFGETSASAKITVTGEPGRTFTLSFRKFPTPANGPWTAVAGTFTSEKVVTGLTYGDVNDQSGHYWFKVTDNLGCTKESTEQTFVPVQQPLKISICCPILAECTGSVQVNVTGGTGPYVVTVNDQPVAGFVPAGSTLTFPAGNYVMKVVDAHGCVKIENFVIETTPVVRQATAHAYKTEKVRFTDAEAKLDTLIAAGVHTFKYDFNGCERTLVVTVIDDLARTATIAEVQGTADVSPMVDNYRQITGTVTGVVPGVGYFLQDAVAPWSGIWVADASLVVLEGNGVKVEGFISEVNGVTTLTAAKVSVVNPPLAITPIVVANPNAGKAEKYESVLVKVEGARFMGAPNPDGSWVIFTEETNKITVNDWMYSYVPKDGHFYTVTGVINGAHDLYKLEPRKLADVVDLSTSTPVIDVNNVQFKVYPNPFSDVLNIDNSEKLTRVTVTNIAGQRVIDVQSPERVIRTSNLVSGVYVVTLFTEAGIAKTERLVKR